MIFQAQSNGNSNFSFQHHVRWNTDIGGVTIWNNGNNQIEEATANASSGMSIRINSDTSATLVAQYVSPGRQLDSSQGSHQVLPNGNHFMGMGSHPFMYEQTIDGTPVWYARFGEFPIQSYRAYKWEWNSSPPESEMALFSYSRNCYGEAAHYVSWNGATDVTAWEFYTASSEDEEFKFAAMQPYNGSFETVVTTPFDIYAYAVALDMAGNRLGQTPTVKTWTPSPVFAANCTEMSCPAVANYTEAPQTDCAAPVQLPVYDSSLPDEAYLSDTPRRAPIAPREVSDVPAYPLIPRRKRKFVR